MDDTTTIYTPTHCLHQSYSHFHHFLILLQPQQRHPRPTWHLDRLALGQSLDSGQSLFQQLLLERRLGNFSVNGSLNGLDERSLLGFSLLLLVSDPAVKDGLEFGFERGFLGEVEVGVFESGSFL
jgi:hypothetical protein